MARVLVIDDSPTIHKVIGPALSSVQVEVTHALGGLEGIAQAKKVRPDLILLDFMMPEFNGYQVCKRLAEEDHLADIPIILMTTKPKLMDQQLIKTMGIIDFVNKPFSPDTIASIVEQSIQKLRQCQEPASDQDITIIRRNVLDKKRQEFEPDKSTGRVALRGKLAIIPIAEVIQLLSFQAYTGILHVTHAQSRLEVYFREGTIGLAQAFNMDREFFLGRFLCQAGSISAKELELHLAKSKQTGQLLGEHLCNSGQITQEQYKQALKRQTQYLLYEAIRWENGEFAFYVTQQLPPHVCQIDIKLSVDQILMEGYRRVDEWGVIQNRISNFDLVLAPCQDRLSCINNQLEEQEQTLLDLVDGRRTIREIIRTSRRSSFFVCKVLYHFLSERLVRILQHSKEYNENKKE